MSQEASWGKSIRGKEKNQSSTLGEEQYLLLLLQQRHIVPSVEQERGKTKRQTATMKTEGKEEPEGISEDWNHNKSDCVL